MNHHRSSSTGRTNHEVLGACLEEILCTIKPSEEDTLQRKKIINQLASILERDQRLKSATVKPFGSFASNLYSKWSDLDISVQLSFKPNASTSNFHKRHLLKRIQRVLQESGFGYDFRYVPLAKVPILICKSGYPAVSCDISIDNYEGSAKSRFILWLAQREGRFRDLVLLIKEWAQAHDINNPKLGTLNSFSLCLLIIYHFQTTKPAIFPPLRNIYDGRLVSDSDPKSIFMVPEKMIEERCIKATEEFNTKNRDTLPELLLSFFEKFSEIGSWASCYAINTYNGKLEDTSLSSPNGILKCYSSLMVIDPFEETYNAASTVRTEGFISISRAFRDTHRHLLLVSTLNDRSRLLGCLARPGISWHPSSSQQQKKYEYNIRLNMLT